MLVSDDKVDGTISDVNEINKTQLPGKLQNSFYDGSPSSSQVEEVNKRNAENKVESRSTLSRLLTILAVVGVMYNILLNGMLASGISVVYVELVRTYDITRTQASLLTTIYAPVATCTSIGNVYIIRRVGYGRCLITGTILTCVGFSGAALATNASQIIGILGVVTAYGHSFLYLCSMTAPQHLVSSEKVRNSLSASVVVVNGLGVTFGSPLMSTLIESFGFNMAMGIFAGITASTCIGNVCIWIRLRDSAVAENKPQKSFSLILGLVRNKTFIIFFCLQICRIIYVVSFGSVQVDHAYTSGFSLETSAFFASAMGFGSLCGRVINGIVFSVKKWRGINQWCITISLYGVGMAFMSLVKTYYEFLTLSVIVGLINGSLSTLQYLLPYEIVDADHYSIVISLLITVLGVSSFIMNPLAGWIRDTAGTYDGLFISALPVCGIFGVLCFVYRMWKYHCKKQPPLIDEETCLVSEQTDD